ncbi:MAG: Holliday junction branch migration protein RuvA [Alphaproteobacteria bacterium]|nr:Holliday junction branch migration protein RuvA [Alphaproteobacteria bacterium]
MIGKLKGMIEELGEDHVLIDVQGVCYIAFCSAKTMGRLPSKGEPVEIITEMVVREDLMRLYGFADPAEKAWFALLTEVQGVGARVALAILSVLTPSELASAIALQDKASVGRANGVGPKLALRIVTELKGKAPDIGGIDAGVLGLQQALGAGAAPSTVADAVSALTNLGYSSQQASAALARIVRREGEDLPTERLIRLGLKELSS